MKKSILFYLIGSFLVFQLTLLPAMAAQDPPASPGPATTKALTWGRPSNVLDIGLGYLYSSSTSSWTIGFADEFGRGQSVLDFNRVEGVPFVSLDIHHPYDYAALCLQWGSGQSFHGDGTDSDYLSGGLYYRSRFDVEGDKAFWTADLQTTFSFTSKPRWVFKPFIGWQHHEEKYTMTNGRWTVLYGQGTSLPLYGLDSRYDFNWDALRLGVRGDWDLAPQRASGEVPLRLKTILAFFPYIRYHGEGVWNLRDDFSKDPSFSHEAENTGLLGLDGTVSLVYRPLKSLEIEGGARISYFSAQDGTDTTYFSNGARATMDLEEAKTLQVGLFIKISGRF